MPTRYLQIPADPFALVNADTGLPIADAPPFGAADVGRALTNQIRQDDKLDALDCMVLRQKLAGGGVVELSEAEHEALKEAAKRPKLLSLHAVFSPDVSAFLRAIHDAPSVKP